jgi:putative endopeptidase
MCTLAVLSLFLVAAVAKADGPEGKKKPAFDLKNLNTSVSPKTDFYEYAIGGWLKNNPIPDQYSSWGSFENLYEENIAVLKKILESAANNKKAPKGSFIQKAGTFYRLGMDEAAIEKDGYTPIKEDLARIDAIKNIDDLVLVTAYFQLNLGSPLFGFGSGADAKNSSMTIAQLGQGGIGLPDRDYYLNDDARSKEIREKYVPHIANMFKLVSVNDATAKKYAETVLSIETQLAKASRSRVDLRDPEKNYNKMQINKLCELAPSFNWNVFFKAIGLENPGDICVGQPEFFVALSRMLKDVSFDDWKVYLKWNVLRNAAPYLSSAFVNERFEFYSKFLNGAKVLTDRWKRVLSAEDGAIGEIVGQLYVKDNFPPEAKARALKIVKSLLVSMGERIKGVDWMSDATKKEALKKLKAFNVKIGYPDKWTDYKKLSVENDSYYKNIIRASYFASVKSIKEIGKKVDKSKWFMTPQTVNAYYEPSLNEIVFPAGILQPPFFDKDADDAINYGAMGAVIGHEVTHGFDDQGRQYDLKGNLADWWTKDDKDKFNEKTKTLVGQFNNFAALDTFKVNGELTLGENIADLGGLTVSMNAFRKTEQFKKNEKIDGFTPVQRFYLSWAQVWKTNIRPETAKMYLKIDVHSPAKARVNAPFRNLPAFFEAFDVKPGDPMRIADEEIVKIW